jgi:hypothetical protein
MEVGHNPSGRVANSRLAITAPSATIRRCRTLPGDALWQSVCPHRLAYWASGNQCRNHDQREPGFPGENLMRLRPHFSGNPINPHAGIPSPHPTPKTPATSTSHVVKCYAHAPFRNSLRSKQSATRPHAATQCNAKACVALHTSSAAGCQAQPCCMTCSAIAISTRSCSKTAFSSSE